MNFFYGYRRYRFGVCCRSQTTEIIQGFLHVTRDIPKRFTTCIINGGCDSAEGDLAVYRLWPCACLVEIGDVTRDKVLSSPRGMFTVIEVEADIIGPTP